MPLSHCERPAGARQSGFAVETCPPRAGELRRFAPRNDIVKQSASHAPTGSRRSGYGCLLTRLPSRSTIAT
jgi:hypothetical protein